MIMKCTLPRLVRRVACLMLLASLIAEAIPTSSSSSSGSAASSSATAESSNPPPSSLRPTIRRRLSKKYIPNGARTGNRRYYQVKPGVKSQQQRTFVLYRPQTAVLQRKTTITHPQRVQTTRIEGQGATPDIRGPAQNIHVYSSHPAGVNVTVVEGIVQPKVTSVERVQPSVPLIRNSTSAAAEAAARRVSRKQQWIHSAKRLNKSRKLSSTTTADGRTLDKQDNLLVSMPKIKDKVRALHQALNSHRQRSRSEHKRIWKDIAKAKNELRRLQAVNAKLKKNNTNISINLRRHISEFTKHRNDVLFRIEDIERHQKTQDLRFFNTFESSQNNSADISELKAQVQTITEQLEYMEHQKMLADNDTLMRIAASNHHFQAAINGQLEPLRELSDDDDVGGMTQQLEESPIFIEPAGYEAMPEKEPSEDNYDSQQGPAALSSDPEVISTRRLTEVIGSQASVIKKQNKTIGSLVDRLMKQDKTMNNMLSDLEWQQETTQKLLTIVTNLGQQMRGPVLQYKDCHDLYLAGHQESGVYSIVRGMDIQPVYCNMTAEGGWTVIQRRMDGTQDFDRDWKDYSNGFGSVYGEYWLGLETIRWLTHSRIYKIAFLITDWNDNQRLADYDQFLVYGQEYVLSVKGFHGDEKDDMVSASNGMPFRVRHQDRSTSIAANAGCTATRRSGWWFPPDCGQANPNGPYSMSLLLPIDTSVDYSVRNAIQPPLVRWLTWRNVTDFLKSITIQIMPSQSMEAMPSDMDGEMGSDLYNDFDLAPEFADTVSIVDDN